MRKIGQIDQSEVRGFQDRYGLQVDGKVGRQTWGQVLHLEQRLARLKEAPAPTPPPPVIVRRFHWTEWALVGLGIGLIVAALVFG